MAVTTKRTVLTTLSFGQTVFVLEFHHDEFKAKGSTAVVG